MAAGPGQVAGAGDESCLAAGALGAHGSGLMAGAGHGASHQGATIASPLLVTPFAFQGPGLEHPKALSLCLTCPTVHLSVPEAEANQPSSPEGLDHPHPLQADPTPCHQGAAQGAAVGGLGQVPAL